MEAGRSRKEGDRWGWVGNVRRSIHLSLVSAQLLPLPSERVTNQFQVSGTGRILLLGADCACEAGEKAASRVVCAYVAAETAGRENI